MDRHAFVVLLFDNGDGDDDDYNAHDNYNAYDNVNAYDNHDDNTPHASQSPVASLVFSASYQLNQDPSQLVPLLLDSHGIAPGDD